MSAPGNQSLESPAFENSSIENETATMAYLETHGIRLAPQGLDPLIEEAVDRLQRTLYRSDPRADLTDAEAEALERGGFSLDQPDLGADDPLVRSAADYAALLKTGSTTSQAAKRLGVDPSRIRQRLTSEPPSLYGLRVGSGWCLPEIQFSGDDLVPGIDRVIGALDRSLHPVAVFRWLTTPQADLSLDPTASGVDQRVSPRDWLLCGGPVEVVVAMAGKL